MSFVFMVSDLPGPVIRYVSGLWRRRWIIIAVTWLVALAGWFAVWTLPDKFESRAHVFVQTETILEPVLKGITARPDYSQRVDVMQQQLLTRPNVEEIIYRAGLDSTIEANSEIERRMKMQGLVNWVGGSVHINSPSDMYFIISYSHGDPVIARNVVDSVLNLFIEQDLGASLAENEAAHRRLDARIDEYRERLAAKDQEIAIFRRNNADELAFIEGNARLREHTQTQIVRAGAEIDQTKQRMASLQNLLSATPRTNSQQEVDALRLQLAELRSRYQENHPDIRGVLSRIDQLETGGGGTLSTNPEYRRLQSEFFAAKGALASLEAREQKLRGELEDVSFTMSQAPAAQAELLRITRDYEQTQSTYEDLISRRETLALTESLGAAGGGVAYQVFERPQISLSPSGPPRMLFIMGAALAAVAAGMGAAVFLTFLEKSYSQVEDLKEAFGLPVLGAVSEVSSIEVVRARRNDLLRLGLASAGLGLMAFGYIYMSVLRLPSERPLDEPNAAQLDLRPGALR